MPIVERLPVRTPRTAAGHVCFYLGCSMADSVDRAIRRDLRSTSDRVECEPPWWPLDPKYDAMKVTVDLAVVWLRAASRCNLDKTLCYHIVMSRTGRKKVAWLCLNALLFLQLAVAAHACPTPMDRGGSAAVAADAQVPPCHGMDHERPKLCEQHCVHDSQSVDTQPHSSVNAPLLALLAVVIQCDLHFATGSSVQGALGATVVEPPPLVRFGVLRI